MSLRRAAEILLLAAISLVLFLGVSEVFLRIYLRNNIFYDVEMSRYANTLKVDSSNPKVGHHHKPSSEAVLMGVRIQTNSEGFRDDEYPVAKGVRRRVMFLGDSLTLGWGVAKEDTFEHLLERDLDQRSPTEVINLGVGNYNTTQELHLFLDKGLEYDPDLVVLFYFINDAEPVPQRSRFPGLGRLRVATFYWSRTRELRSRLSGGGPSFQEYYSALYADDAAGWVRSREALATLARTSREHGFDFRVVLLPELHGLDPYLFSAEHALVVGALRELGVPALDLAPHFEGEKDPLALWVSLDDAHPNARAHRLIANYSLEFIASAESRP